MPGNLVPLVLIPRYTTYGGATTFTTIAMDVMEYDTAIVNLWRAPLGGTGPTFGVTFQESMDQNTWTTCGGTTANSDPGSTTETQYNATLTKRWFRIQVTLTGSNPFATCYGIGFLQERLT